MTYVVQSPCVDCKYGDCIEVCPADAFREADKMLVIEPDECIHCGLCEPVCPVGAIVADDFAEKEWIQKNIDLSKDGKQCWSSDGKDSISHGTNWLPPGS